MAGQSSWSNIWIKFELNRKPGGDVDGVFAEYASTRTASGTSGKADSGPRWLGVEGVGEKQSGGGASPELTPARRGSWPDLEG